MASTSVSSNSKIPDNQTKDGQINQVHENNSFQNKELLTLKEFSMLLRETQVGEEPSLPCYSSL